MFKEFTSAQGMGNDDIVTKVIDIFTTEEIVPVTVLSPLVGVQSNYYKSRTRET
jgi:hypothetical protein